MLVTVAYEGQAQWANHIDTSANWILRDIPPASHLFGASYRSGSDVIFITNDTSSWVYLNGIQYDPLNLSTDHPLEEYSCRMVDRGKDNDSTLVLSGLGFVIFNPVQGLICNVRTRVTNIANPDSTELAVTFRNVSLARYERIKDVYVTDSNLYVLIDGLTDSTTVEVVLNNGQPQTGTPLTGTDNSMYGTSAFLKIDRFTGAIVKQVYFHHNDNDNGVNITYWNIASLLAVQNRFYFTSVNSWGGNFTLHVYDRNLDSIADIPILTDTVIDVTPARRKEMVYGVYDGEEYLGFVAQSIPIIVNVKTLDVTYITDGMVFNVSSGKNFSTRFASFIDSSAFIFLNGGLIWRIELSTMTPSIIRHDWLTNNPLLNGKGTTSAQRNARVGGVGILDAIVENGEIHYRALNGVGKTCPNGLYVNGEQITGDTLFKKTFSSDYIFYKGRLGLNMSARPGTETTFSCSTCDSIVRLGNRVIYVVSDSASLANIQLTRTTGAQNITIQPNASDTVDFSNDTSIVSFSLDFLGGGDISAIWVYVETAMVVPTDTTGDTSGVTLDEHQRTYVSFYPNPFDNFISIAGAQNRNYSVALYDLSGRVIFRREEVGEPIDVSHLIRGMYIAHVYDNHGNRVSTIRVVKR